MTDVLDEDVVYETTEDGGEIETLAVDQRPMLGRTYETIELARDGRNVEMLCAPYDRPALVDDGHGPYQEEFARGAFAGATKAPNRVLMEFEHFAPGLSGVIGRGAHFEEKPDALYGRFRVLKQADGDKALELIDEEVLTAASVFFGPIKTMKLGRSHVRRLRVQLDRVALARVGAYPEARVLAVRSAPIPAEVVEEIVEIPESARVIPFDPDLRARIEAAGLVVPSGLQ